jgi:cell division septal protein FtsQ
MAQSTKNSTPSSSTGLKSGSLRKRPNRKKRNWGEIIGRFLLFSAIVAGLVWLCNDRRFDIRSIRVEGISTVTQQEIEDLAHARMGRNVFVYTIANHRAIEKRIIKGEPAIESVQVYPSPPNSILVQAHERTPFVQVRINRGPLLMVDPNGVAYRLIQQRDLSLPVVVVPADTPVPALGHKFSLNVNTPFGVGYSIIHIVRQGGYFEPLKLRDVRVESNLISSIAMDGRPLIRLGLPTDLPKKIATAAAAINSDPVKAGNAEYVDVTLPEKPAIKLKSESSLTDGGL